LRIAGAREGLVWVVGVRMYVCMFWMGWGIGTYKRR
jgi:hypothetical protein